MRAALFIFGAAAAYGLVRLGLWLFGRAVERPFID
jgi:hypothetical protein